MSFAPNRHLERWPLDRAREMMTHVIRLTDICLPSDDDVAALAGMQDPDALIDRCLSLGSRTVAPTPHAEQVHAAIEGHPS